MKGRSPCHSSIKLGHWVNDHNDDGTIRQGMNSSENLLNSGSNDSNKNGEKKKVMIGFNSTFCSTKDTFKCNIAVDEVSMLSVGPLVNDVATYSSIF